ncbi:MAG TPA: sugar ABC transporter substrate-binding protein [Arsenicitalea sp.]|nr:sugar ABC transporter substrate-binding protein [Arsenicitalea sp.]
MSDSMQFNRRDTLALVLSGFVAAALGGKALAQDAKALSFWAVHTGTPELAAAMQTIIDQFEKEKAGTNVKFESVNGALVYPKFLTAVQGQSMPDVADGYSYHPLQFAALDQMLPLDDLIGEWKENGLLDQVVNEYAYKKFLWNGHYWAVPWNLDIRAIYYRKDLLEKAGVKPPTNWDEFQAAAIKLNDPANGTFGFVFPAGNFHIAQHFYMMFMLQAGGSILDKDGNLVFGTTSKDANVQALTYLTDFALKHKVTPEGIASYNTDEPHTLFIQGRAAFATGTGGLISRLLKEAPDMVPNVGVLEVLQGPKAKLAAGFYNPLFVWKYSPNVDLAKEFVSWLVQPGRLQPLYTAYPGNCWPILKSEFNSEVFKKTPLLADVIEKVIPYTTDFAYPGTGIPQMGAIDGEKMFAAPVNEVIAGTKTPEQAVLDAHANMAKLFT